MPQVLGAQMAQLAAQMAQLAAATQAQMAQLAALVVPIAVSVAELYNSEARHRNTAQVGDIMWPKLIVGAVGAVPAPNHGHVIRTFANLAAASMARVTYYVNFYGLAPAGIPNVEHGRLLLRAFV